MKLRMDTCLRCGADGFKPFGAAYVPFHKGDNSESCLTCGFVDYREPILTVGEANALIDADNAIVAEAHTKNRNIMAFWDKVTLGETDSACWEWTGAVSNGKGMMRWHGRDTTAVRVSWEIEYGELPSRPVYRTCGNTLCVNAEHLTIDRPSKRRRIVKREAEAGLSIRQIAERHSMARSTVWDDLQTA